MAGMNPRQSSPTDLCDRAWDLSKHLVSEAQAGGWPEEYPKRAILNAIGYLRRRGCSWRLLPHDRPPWRLVYHYCRQGRQDGTWQVMHDLLRGAGRVAAGKRRQPKAGINDSPAVTTPAKGEPRLRFAPTEQRPQTSSPRRSARVDPRRGGHGGQ